MLSKCRKDILFTDNRKIQVILFVFELIINWNVYYKDNIHVIVAYC